MRSPSSNTPISEEEEPFPFGEDPSPQYFTHANALENLTSLRKEISRVGNAAHRGNSPAAVSRAFRAAWDALDQITRNLEAATTELGESVGEYE